MTSDTATYEYAFIGMGCANSLLLLELHRAGLLHKGQIVVYEPSLKEQNDRTFCFWLEPKVMQETGLDGLVTHSWSHVKCTNEQIQQLEDKRYYYIRSETLYSRAKEILAQYEATWIPQQLERPRKNLARYVFDSRPPRFEKSTTQKAVLSQSFYGWIVHTEKPVFDPHVFTMMDFAFPQNGHTQFLYILPFDQQTALIEPTRFGSEIMTESQAEQYIVKYLIELQTPYEIKEKEQGCIPMASSAPLDENLPSNWYRTGAAGGQLKPSTGYSFVRSLTDAQQMADSLSLKREKLARRNRIGRFDYYDRLLLQILSRTPHRGKAIFERLFAKNHAVRVLDFLDEKTRPLEEFKLMSSLPIGWFVSAALRDLLWTLRSKAKQISPALLVVLLCLCVQSIGQISWVWPILLIGFFIVGLPHGALDHLHILPDLTRQQLLKYVVWYLILGMSVLAFWFVSPILALFFFLIYSVWHFGQADLQIWRCNRAIWHPFLWGSYYLMFLLATHKNEVGILLTQMHVGFSLQWSHEALTFISKWPFWCIMGIIPLTILKSWRVAEAILILVLLSQVPLLESFATFFIFQHSVNGWKHLVTELPYDSKSLWLHALPFTLGSIVLFAGYFHFIEAKNWGIVFVFLSALSFPHVFFMNRFYKK